MNIVSRRGQLFFLWFIVGCIVSLLIHVFLFKKIETWEIATFNPLSFDTVVPRKFHLERVHIDPDLVEKSENKKLEIMHPSVDVSALEIKNVSSKNPPNGNNMEQQLIDDNKLKAEKPESLLENNIIPENIQKANQPLLPLDTSTRESSFGDLVVNSSSNSIAAYSGLDQLLQQNRPLSTQTAPILLPTDLLFEYDADQLKVDAEKSLKKLALLIQRNPKAQFIVEGFTDSFGSDEYNLDLSTRRANTIKQWLIKKELINPIQIKSYGLGKTHFIVPSNGTIQQQSLNRRVEIVIRQNTNQ
ncbi:MAG: OmpA family protein [Chthoniobacterales bacterium]